LPEDLTKKIISYTNVSDIETLRQSSKDLNLATQNSDVYIDLTKLKEV